MASLCWTEDLSVDNKAIDDDHRHLFDLLDRLQHTMPSGLVTAEAITIVDDLAEYVENHFNREEVFMQRINYADYPLHKAEHDRFVSEVHALQSRLGRGAHTLTLSIDKVLNEWLRRHVLVMDKALAASLKENPAHA